MMGKHLIAMFTMQSSVLSTQRKGGTGSYGPQTQGRYRGSQGTSELWKDPTAQNGSDHQRKFSQVKYIIDSTKKRNTLSTQGICKPWARREHRAAGLLLFLHGKAMQMQPVLAKMGSSSSSLQDAWATREYRQSVVLDTIQSKCMEHMNHMTFLPTPIKNPIKGTSVRPVNASESSLGGLFSGERNMWEISAFGPNFENGSTACAGGRGAFSGASGRSNSKWPRGRRNEFSWAHKENQQCKEIGTVGVGQNYIVTYHCSITNCKLKVISSRKVVKFLHQT